MSVSTWLLLVHFCSHERSEDHGTVRLAQASVMLIAQKAIGRSKARTFQSDTLQHIGRRMREARSSGRCGLFFALVKSVRTCGLPFWGGKTLENTAHRRRLNACGLHHCRTTSQHHMAVCTFLRVRALGTISFRTCHRSAESLESVHGVSEPQSVCRVVLFSKRAHPVFFNRREHTRSLNVPMQVFPRFTASRTIFLISWTARLLIAKVFFFVFCRSWSE